MPEISVKGLTKRFGAAIALDGVSFTVADGELFTLLGPSGCGKTSTLLSVAGFLKPDQGEIRCGETTLVDTRRNAHLPAERRNLGMVFQSYAVWPHMTVAENVAFPLRIRRFGRTDRRARVAEILDLVELGELAERYPHQLSGGQRQRVALARALVYQPSVLLLDEPFSNLDAKLRERARSWLKHLQHQLGLTTLFVTHDQDEAMAMSNRILVMDQGRVQQVGTPEQIYHRPANRFVASFLGRCNYLDGVVASRGSNGTVEVALGKDGPRLVVAVDDAPEVSSPVGIAIRPESVKLISAGIANGDAGTESPNVFDVAVGDVSFLGDHYEYELTVGGIKLVALSARQVSGTQLRAAIEPSACVVVGRGEV
ncbi:MAG TPA: ABC transporter ATP-binding protein [Solirubrobacteraceae bacterium]|nr:ABC transporter ATP-binding protein [Solirubrobacteraceae bacterium]